MAAARNVPASRPIDQPPVPAALPLPKPVLHAGDVAALQGLLGWAMAETGAPGAWWEGPAAEGPAPVLAAAGDATAADAGGAADTVRHAAAFDGQVLAWLVLRQPRRPVPPALVALLQAAAALLRARTDSEAWRLEAERLHDAGRAAMDWLWETDADGRIAWMSESVSATTGRSAADEVGTLTLDHNRPRTDEYAASWDAYLKARAALQPIRDLVLDRDTACGTVTISINGNPRFAPDGRFLGYRGATRNITAEVQARSQARQAQQLLQQALEGVPAGVMISGPDDRILMANQRWRDTIGRDLPPGCDTWDGVIRHHVMAGHYPEAIGREEDYVAWRRARASESPKPVELRWRDQWVMSADRLLADGSIVHLSIYVTERKRAEEALARAEDRWRFALEGAGQGVWDWDREAGMYFSPSWVSMLGHEEHEIGRSWREWERRLHPLDRARVLRELRRHWRGESPIYETEYRLRHRDGHYLWIHDRGRVITRSPLGRPRRLVGTHSDITRLRLADQALRDKQAAELVSRSTSEFLSRMSHEMRTPLNAVIGFAELLRTRGEHRAEHVEHILAAGRHLLELINDVLDLQQVEQGGLSLRPGGVHVGALVRHVEAMLQPQADKLGVTQSRQLFGEMNVQADEQRLRQVLLNLGSNAIKYNRPGGLLRWCADRSDPERWGIVVEDTGPGLDHEQLARLFRPFERLGRETSATEGSGLGLVIARRLAEAMGGEVVMRSHPGQGTRATVWLPRAAVAAAQDADDDVAQAATPVAAPATRQVLYVEDNPINALLFAEALRDSPALQVRVAEHGDEALAIVRDWRPDLLVIDMHLPGATGSQVLRQLRALPGLGQVPAVMCSADALPGDRARALADGFVGYWTKPLDVMRLAADIEAVINGG